MKVETDPREREEMRFLGKNKRKLVILSRQREKRDKINIRCGPLD